jgi:hypothetical protein
MTDPAPSPRVTLTCGSRLLATTGATDRATLTEAIARRLPRDGLSNERVGVRYHLTRATTRLLDSRIVDAALQALDLEVTQPLVTGLSRFRELRRAAGSTLTDPAAPETTVVLLEPCPLVSTHGVEVVVHVDGERVAAVPFSLTLTVELGETSVVVRHGAITEVVAEVGSLSASFTAADLDPPLWTGSAPALSVHLAVQPPVDVPLATPDPVPGVPEPRRTTERPPVPAAVRSFGRG